MTSVSEGRNPSLCAETNGQENLSNRSIVCFTIPWNHICFRGEKPSRCSESLDTIFRTNRINLVTSLVCITIPWNDICFKEENLSRCAESLDTLFRTNGLFYFASRYHGMTSFSERRNALEVQSHWSKLLTWQ